VAYTGQVSVSIHDWLGTYAETCAFVKQSPCSALSVTYIVTQDSSEDDLLALSSSLKCLSYSGLYTTLLSRFKYSLWCSKCVPVHASVYSFVRISSSEALYLLERGLSEGWLVCRFLGFELLLILWLLGLIDWLIPRL